MALACAAPWAADPIADRLAELDQAIEAVDVDVVALRAAERRKVQERLDAAEGFDVEAVLLGERLGLDVPPLPGWQPEAPNGRELGVRKDHGAAILDGVRAEYRVEVDEAAWGGAAAEALGVEAHGSPEAAIEQAIGAGMAESVAVVWGVEAALHSLDPYTQPVWPAQVQAWSEHHEGVALGTGVTVEQRASGEVVVTGLHEDSMAWVSGIHVGDVVRTVDGEPVVSVDEVRRLLRVDEGRERSIGVQRADGISEFSVMGQELSRSTAFGWRHIEAGDIRDSTHQRDVPRLGLAIAYVRLTSFTSSTDEELASLLVKGPFAAAVLDLRGNPGGDVQAALNVADAWLEDGELVSMRGRAAPVPDPPGEGEAAWNEATPGGPLVGLCTAVLVDQETASAAEILAGVLQQRAGATVIGAPTAGKAVSQGLRADDELGVAWQVTNLAWALPDGTELVAGEGLTPDVRYEPTPAEAWQTARMAAVRQAPKTHPDGVPVPWLGPVVGEGFPELRDDPMVLRAQRELWRRCFR